jgi:O-antigen/teichoic acid export membrane protein
VTILVRRIASAALRPFRRFGGLGDYAVTFATEGLTLVLGLAVFKLAAVYWGPSGFGEYVLARRGVGLIYLPVSCGMGLAVTRFVAAMSTGGSSPWAVLRAGSAIVAIATAGALALLNLAPELSGRLLFGEDGHAGLIRAVSLASTGMVMHGLAYAFFRGRSRLMSANALQLVNLGIVPVLVFARPGVAVELVVAALGVVWILTALTALTVSRLRDQPAAGPVADPNLMRDMAKYGLPRVPGELALSALFALPAVMVAHAAGVVPAGHLSFSISILTMIGSVFAPIGVIVLPSLSAAIAGGKSAALWTDAKRMVLACVAGAMAMILVIEWLAPTLVTVGLGPEFAGAVSVVRVVAPAGIPFVVYVVLRNMLDAAAVQPHNARNLVLAVVTLLVIGFALGSPASIPGALVAALVLLGSLTLRDTRRVLMEVTRRA